MKFSAIVRALSVLVAAAAVLSLLRVSDDTAPTAVDAVRSAFAAYKQAVLSADGDKAAAALTEETLTWYGHIQQIALHGNRQEVQHLSAADKLEVLAFRERVPADQLRTMTPRELVAYSVAHGWVAKTFLRRSECGDVKLSGNVAEVDVTIDGKVVGQPYRFVKQGGRWRFDQLPILTASNAEVTKGAALHRMSEDDYVFALVESAAGKKLSADIWTPPFPEGNEGNPQ